MNDPLPWELNTDDRLNASNHLPVQVVFKNPFVQPFTEHTHHPVDDAKGNAEAMLARIKEFDLKIRF